MKVYEVYKEDVDDNNTVIEGETIFSLDEDEAKNKAHEFWDKEVDIFNLDPDRKGKIDDYDDTTGCGIIIYQFGYTRVGVIPHDIEDGKLKRCETISYRQR